jgi:hypothetical protein
MGKAMTGFGDSASLAVEQGRRASDGATIRGVVTIECFDWEGKLKWVDTNHNIVVNVGLQHILDVTFENITQATEWYVGLKDGGTPAAGDTMASHGTWVEYENYSEGTRPAFNDTRTGQQIDNAGNKAAFSINGSGGTVGGAFICDENTKGGTTGTLMCAEDASEGDRSVVSGDTINVSYTITASDVL